jgi:hypothetical protein
VIKILKFSQTNLACPTQWDAWTDQGERIYIRYRFGRLLVMKVAAKFPYTKGSWSTVLMDRKMTDNPWAGSMALWRMKKLTEGVLDFTSAVEMNCQNNITYAPIRSAGW